MKDYYTKKEVDALIVGAVEEAKEIEEEAGDLLLHVLFYAKLGEEKKLFSIERERYIQIFTSICYLFVIWAVTGRERVQKIPTGSANIFHCRGAHSENILF